MDLNHVFLFIAVVSPLLVLARAWRPGGILGGWRIAAIIVLAITGIAWLCFRDYAGFVGGSAWFALLFLPVVGLRKVSQLAAQGRYEPARRIATALQFVHPTAELREQLQFFRAHESQHQPYANIEVESLPDALYRRLRSAPTVAFLILTNVAVYGVELLRGATNNRIIMHRLGALDPVAVIHNGEFWRLFSALFLHENLVHLGFNLFALYIIGPSLEKILGTIRFAGGYLISGIGSTLGVVALTQLKILRPAEVIGASGCVMGIVGVWAGFLLRHRHLPHAKRRLLNILLIIAIQVVFDILTPQVSSSAHLCGLVTGFVIGLAFAPRRTSLATP